MDKLTPEARSRNMARIRSRDTLPELAVRRFMHGAGLRYRLHAKHLPGKPDLVFASRRACLFVHGCFWHGCPRCVDGTRKVKSNVPYWSGKLAGNRARDELYKSALEAAGWRVFVIWECETRDANRMSEITDELMSFDRRR